MKSYRDILDKIGETNRIIDYLKMDTEGAEIQFFENVLYEDASLLDNVKQIGMEIHPGKDPDRRDQLWRQMHKLQSLNFRPIFRELNLFTTFQYNGRTVSNAYEITWVNDNF
ncbi:Methyltransferase FkbM, partial [Trinorchestia longiramus]